MSIASFSVQYYYWSFDQVVNGVILSEQFVFTTDFFAYPFKCKFLQADKKDIVGLQEQVSLKILNFMNLTAIFFFCGNCN